MASNPVTLSPNLIVGITEPRACSITRDSFDVVKRSVRVNRVDPSILPGRTQDFPSIPSSVCRSNMARAF